jgi:hypothetical protein
LGTLQISRNGHDIRLNVLIWSPKKDCIALVVAPGKMGERYTSAWDMPFKVIGAIGADTSREKK